jgi:hypothetical protein
MFCRSGVVSTAVLDPPAAGAIGRAGLVEDGQQVGEVGQGVAEADRGSGGDAGRQAQDAALAVAARQSPASSAAIAASQSMLASMVPWSLPSTAVSAPGRPAGSGMIMTLLLRLGA